MRAQITVKFKDGTEYTSLVECDSEVRRYPNDNGHEVVSAEAVLRRKVRMLQKRHPGAEISWREEVEA